MVNCWVAVRDWPAVFLPVMLSRYVAAGSNRSAAVQLAPSLLIFPGTVPLTARPFRSM